MTKLKFTDYVPGNTSDHTWQSAEVYLANANEQKFSKNSVKLTTWNMQNKCFSKQKCRSNPPYSNNPFDMDEDDNFYRERKLAQIDELKDIIQQVGSDFILLQECDWTFKLIANYEQALGLLGYKLIKTPSATVNRTKQRQLVTLYNAEKYDVKSNSGKGVFKTTGTNGTDDCYYGYAVDFIAKDSKEQMTVVNLHLAFHHNYQADIDNYLEEQTENNKFTIMGGDTNHAQNQDSIAMIGNWHYPTNIDIVDEKNEEQIKNFVFVQGKKVTDQISVEVNGKDMLYKKRYDGFFACPTKQTKVIIKELEGRYFDLKNGHLQVKILHPSQEYPSHYIHSSDVGEHWKRSEYRKKNIQQRQPQPAPLPQQPILVQQQQTAASTAMQPQLPPLQSQQPMFVQPQLPPQPQQPILVQQQQTTTVATAQPQVPQQGNTKPRQHMPLGFKIALAIGVLACAATLTIGLLAFFNIIALPFLPFVIAAGASAAATLLTGVAYAGYQARQRQRQTDAYIQTLPNSQVNTTSAGHGGNIATPMPLPSLVRKPASGWRTFFCLGREEEESQSAVPKKKSNKFIPGW